MLRHPMKHTVSVKQNNKVKRHSIAVNGLLQLESRSLLSLARSLARSLA